MTADTSCAPSRAASQLKLTTEINETTAVFSSSETIINVDGRNGVLVPRGHWKDIVAASGKFDQVIDGFPPSADVAMSWAGARTAVSQRAFPELGDPIGGGFCAGRHPTIDGAVLIVASHLAEGSGLKWQPANDHCTAYRGGDFADWRAPDRLEALILWERLGAPKTHVASFKKDEPEAFADAAYWTNQEYEFGSGCAWAQAFGCGYSDDWGKCSVLRVRPVRIHFI